MMDVAPKTGSCPERGAEPHCFHVDPTSFRGAGHRPAGTNGVCCWCGKTEFHQNLNYREVQHGPFKP